MKKLAALILLLIIVAALSGCGEDFVHEGHELIGSWRADGNHGRQIHFHADGTGARNPGQAFTWTILRNGNLRLSQDGENTTYNVGFDEGSFRMWVPNSLAVVRYLPTTLPEHLQGTWVWDQDDSYTLVLYATGRGHRGFGDDRQRFGWMVEERSNLTFAWTTGPSATAFEPWSYAIEGNILTITTRLRGDSTQWSYVRVKD
ncbi:MAG: hypothetical protein FWC73_11070 [Defluviitaleaceae bacterium]|nr:hypothetical protein [Defluviitaleaceae bacterium]